MFYVTYRLSQGNSLSNKNPFFFFFSHCFDNIDTHPNYYTYNNLLSDGWLFGRKVDNSDIQYSQFRNHLPLLFALASVYLIGSHIYKAVVQTKRKNNLKQTYFYLFASILVVTALHGTSAIKIFLIVTTSYMIGRLTGGSWWNPLLTWVFNLIILFLNEYYKGFKFESIGFPEMVRVGSMISMSYRRLTCI